MWNKFSSHYDALLKQRKEEASTVGVEANYKQLYGRPGPAICEQARIHKINLIVIGSRNHTYLKELVLGSVSNYIVHHAPCSVTIVHSDSSQQTSQKTIERKQLCLTKF